VPYWSTFFWKKWLWRREEESEKRSAYNGQQCLLHCCKSFREKKNKKHEEHKDSLLQPALTPLCNSINHLEKRRIEDVKRNEDSLFWPAACPSCNAINHLEKSVGIHDGPQG